MQQSDIHYLFDNYQNQGAFDFKGKCHDCGVDVKVSIDPRENGFEINGGAVYWPDKTEEKFFLKCESCREKNPTLKNFQECEVYSRVVGYLRPVDQWNPGKQAEYKDRRNFNSEMITNAIRGIFLTNSDAKHEFMDMIK